jgi:hypothetical protein
MKSTLALVAMATVATANASAPDAVLANAMAFVDANNGRRVLASAPSPSGDETTYMKGNCVKGQATDIANMKATGMDLVIPTAGFCINSDDGSMLLTCDGVTLYAQQDEKTACKGITKDTTKSNATSFLGPCLIGEVQGVSMEMWTKSDCSGASTGSFVLAADSCLGSEGDKGKFSCKGDKITVGQYTDSKCAGAAKDSITFTSGDGKCHGPPGSESNAPAPAPASSASSVALTAGIAFAGLIASLALM